MDLGLSGLKAVLAGASKGIGRRVAETLVAEGCSVAICARDQTGVDEALTLMASGPGRAIGHSVDVTDGDAYKRWIDESAAELGGCDIFIAFGSGGGGPTDEEAWRRNFDIDVLGTWRGIEAALPHLRQSQDGSIVVVGTSVTVEPAFGPQAYAAMKSAITNYAGALATKLAPEGIRVNTVAPGPVLIEGGDWDKIQRNMPEVYERNLAKIPMGRLGTPEEVARAIAFLASPACPWLIGANLVIDGGFTKRVQH